MPWVPPPPSVAVQQARRAHAYRSSASSSLRSELRQQEQRERAAEAGEIENEDDGRTASSASGAVTREDEALRVDLEALWRGDYPLETYGVYRVSDRLVVEERSPVDEKGVRVFDSRPERFKPARATWTRAQQAQLRRKLQGRICLGARERIAEMKENLAGESMALTRNTWPGPGHSLRQPPPRWKELTASNDSPEVYGRNWNPEEERAKTTQAQLKVLDDFWRGPSWAMDTISSIERQMEAQRARLGRVQGQLSAPPASRYTATKNKGDNLAATSEGCTNPRQTQDLIGVTKWLTRTGKVLDHCRQTGSAELELTRR